MRLAYGSWARLAVGFVALLMLALVFAVVFLVVALVLIGERERLPSVQPSTSLEHL